MPKEQKLLNKKVAILATNGFEQSELFEPLQALQEAGAQAQIISLKSGEIKGWDKKDWGKSIGVDELVKNVSADEFDALLLPGGVMNPDTLRDDKQAVEFVRSFVESGKPIAAICHGPWTLIEAGGVENLTLTSYSSIKTDLLNAGAIWVDEEVVTDHGIVTSRKPEDLPAFCEKMIEEFAEGKHSQRMVSKRSLQSVGTRPAPMQQIRNCIRFVSRHWKRRICWSPRLGLRHSEWSICTHATGHTRRLRLLSGHSPCN